MSGYHASLMSLLFGVLGVLVTASVISFVLARRMGRDDPLIENLTARINAWWVMAAVLGLASIAVILKPDAAPEWPSLMRFLEVGAAIVVMILYAIFLPELGFIVATALAATYLTWRLGSRPISSVVSGCATSIGIYAVFHLVLGLSLAKGPLGF